jgi:hypothetical protein
VAYNGEGDSDSRGGSRVQDAFLFPGEHFFAQMSKSVTCSQAFFFVITPPFFASRPTLLLETGNLTSFPQLHSLSAKPFTFCCGHKKGMSLSNPANDDLHPSAPMRVDAIIPIVELEQIDTYLPSSSGQALCRSTANTKTSKKDTPHQLPLTG